MRDSSYKNETPFEQKIASEAARKIRVQSGRTKNAWFGLGMSGLIGWSIAVPTLAGALAGVWLDRHHSGGHSWTLALLAAGLAIGCANAWRWVAQQDKAMRDE